MNSKRTLCFKFSVGKALTVANAVRPERTTKKEKRIVIELGIWEVKLECSVD